MALKLLFVDDDATTLVLLTRLAEARGHIALAARSGAEALDLARREHPHAITLDIQMPGLDGRDVIARLKGMPETAAIPVFIVSGMDEEYTRQTCFEYGAEDYLLKPFDLATVIGRIERSIGGGEREAPG